METHEPAAPSDLTGLSLEEALGVVDEPAHRCVLICSRSEAPEAERILDGLDLGRRPFVVFVPDELLKDSSGWALIGTNVQVVNRP